jgi:3-oxoacyl-(acyl-carrier-protein) synthase
MTLPDVTIAASATLGPVDVLPFVPGFVGDFAPLVRALARRCLGEHPTGLLAVASDRRGIVLASASFDTTSLERSAEQVRRGGRIDALLFHQTVPNTVLGVLSCDYGITGPMFCVSGPERPYDEAVAVAGLMIADGAADAMLAIGVELPTTAGEFLATAGLLRLGPQR